MSKKDNKTKITEKQYKHLTKDDRVKIEILKKTLNKNGKRMFSNVYIANVVEVHN